MSAFSFDVHRESFAEAQNRFAGCFIRQIIPERLQQFLDALHSVVLVSAYQSY